jgi:nicotinate-nucleotide adenylyltransferase
MKVGIFGGTFDPIHTGHLIVADAVREKELLDRVIFVPSCVSPHKQGQPVTPPADRLAMVRAAVSSNPAFEASALEIDRGGVSFTIDTLRILKAEHPGDQLHLMIGADNLAEFATWKDPGEILRYAVLVAMRRPGFSGGIPAGGVIEAVRFCEVPEIGISSTEIRRRVGRGLSVRYLVPVGVERYIAEKNLYRIGGGT